MSSSRKGAPRILSGFLKIQRLFLISANLFFFLSATSLFSASFWQLHFQRPARSLPGEALPVFVVKKNQQLPGVAQKLAEKQLIASKERFLKWMLRFGLDRHYQAGRFRVKKDTTLWQLMKQLCTRTFEKVTLPEGLTLQQIAKRFASHGLDQKRFLNLCRDQKFIRSLGIQSASLEGCLFPDTYKIGFGESEPVVIQLMVRRFFRVIQSMHLSSSLIYQRAGLKAGVTVASLIEKETPIAEERAKVSGVFWNRLNQGWRLDSDVTVHYAIRDWDKTLTKKDLLIDSPYNTRKNKGLPPTPICNPGQASIQAAFFPEKHDYLFFIYSEMEKKTLFCETQEEHVQLKKKIKKENASKP